jgi:hypothetical protein
MAACLVVIALMASAPGPRRRCRCTWTSAFLARATLPILRQIEGRPSELVVALLPSLVRTMLAAFVDAIADQKPAELA